MSDIINTKVTAPYSTSNDLELTPPGSIVVKESGNDNLYALYFSADDLTGTLNGAISCTGNGIETYGIKFIDDGSLIFSAGKMAVTVSGNQTAYGLVGSTLELSAAAGVLGGTINVSAESDFTATAAAFECDTELGSVAAMTVSVSAAGGFNANATGFDDSLYIEGGFDDQFKLDVTAHGGAGYAQALGAAKKISAAGQLGGAIAIMADAVKGTDAEAVGFNRVSGITDVGANFKLNVTAKAGSGNATAYASSSNFELSGVLTGKVNVIADAVKGNDATACGFSRIDGASTISSKFKYTVCAKAGRGNVFAEGTHDAIDVVGVAAGKFTVAADAAKGLSAVAYGAKAISASSISDNLSFTVKAKSDTDIAFAQGLSQQSVVSGAFSGKFTVSAENLAALGGYAYGLSGIQSESVSDKFKLTVSAKSKSSDASATGFDGALEQSGVLSGTVTVIATAAGEAKSYGATAGISCARVSDKFKLTVDAKSMSSFAIAQGVIGWFSPNGVLSGSMVVMADAAKGSYAEAVGLDNLGAGGSFSDKFVLAVTAQGGTQYASAKGISDSLVASGPISGSFAIFADAAKGTDVSSCFVSNSINAASGFGDNFKLAVTANAGTGDATAFFAKSLTVTSGVFSGDVAVVANAAKGRNATANGVTDNLSGSFAMSDQFNMSVIAHAGAGTASAQAFKFTSSNMQLAGTIAVTAVTATGLSAEAYGLRYAGFAGVDDQFKLSVTAGAGAGSATALGIGGALVTLGGTIDVTAESKTGTADAVGGNVNVTFPFGVGSQCLITVNAKSGSSTATATGLGGFQGEVDMAGQLVVTASGSVASTAYGIRLDQLYSGSTVSGIASAVGSHGVGIYSGDGSQLTVTGGVFGGTKGNALSIAKSLQKAVGSYKSALALAKNTDQAIVLGNGSNLSLSAGSVAIGSVTLGSGSTLNLSTGAQLCGDLLMTSGDVSITVDSMLTKAAMVSLSTAGASVFAPASGVNISVSANAGTQAGSYVLLAGSDLSALDNFNFDTLYHLSGFDTNDLVASWQLDHGKTDTLTLIVSEKPASSSLIFESRTFESTVSLLSASSLADDLLTGDSAWKHTTLA